MKNYFAMFALLLIVTGNASAHTGMEHVMGVVASITDTNISVTTTKGKILTVAVSVNTKYLKADSSVTLKDIKVGDHIVIHATKKGDQLTAAEVKIGGKGTPRGDGR